MNDLDALVAVLSPPAARSPSRTWAETTRALGVQFDANYRDLLDTYGEGTIGGHVRSGTATWPDDIYPLPMFPEQQPCLLPVAANGNADTIFLVVDDNTTQEDGLWIGNLKEQLWLERAGPLSRLLLQVVTGDDVEGVYALFGDWTWRLRPEFEPKVP